MAQYFHVGNTPQPQHIQNLVEWISQNLHEEIFYTDSLAQVYPEAEKIARYCQRFIGTFHFQKSEKLCFVVPPGSGTNCELGR